ncbi:MAG: sensor histidine kinase [Lachnospiraceae bacterium]|nr:sensor histidine kinase [Lachnospiraceae bacterium]
MKNNVKRLFNRFSSIQRTMMISFSLVILLAMLIFMIIAFNHTRSVAFANSIELTTSITSKVNDNIDSYFINMENIATIVTEGGELSRYLFTETERMDIQSLYRGRLVDQFATIMDTHHDIANIAVIADNDRMVVNYGDESFSAFVDIRSQYWYQATRFSQEGQLITPTHVQNVIPSSYEWVITLSRALVNPNTGQREGVFFIDLNFSSISALCSNQLHNRGYIFILDNHGDIVYHPKQQLLFGGLIHEDVEKIMAIEASYAIIESGRDSIIYTKSVSDITGWSVIGVNFASDLLLDSHQTQLVYGVVSLVLFVLVIIVSAFISREITRPIRDLKDAMVFVEHGEFHKANIEVVANNELGSLTQSFNTMTKEIDHLMKANVSEQKEKRRQELRALQAQINPHFLYNTLDSIIWMSEAGRNDDVVEMTSSLARLFRQIISNEQEEISIREEIEYLKDYLNIQQMRYKDKMVYHIEIMPEIHEERIVKFSLQPLVENAIYHGLKYKENRGELRIKGYLAEDKVHLEIQDNGRGMDAETLLHIFDEKQSGVGINNIQKRLKLYYGADYGIYYESQWNQGTVAHVILPRRAEDETKL